MDSPSIDFLVEQVLAELRKAGLKDSTVGIYGKYLKRLRLFFEVKNDAFYSDPVMRAYKEKIQTEIEAGIITKRYFNALKRAAYLVEDYVKTGTIKWKVYTNNRKFQPSDGINDIIQSALKMSGLKPDFQYKLDCILRKFCCYLEDQGIHSLDEVSQGAVRDFIIGVRKSNAGSMDYVVYSLKLFCNYLYENSLIKRKINFEYCRPQYATQRIVPAFEKAEIQKMLLQVDRNSDIGKRDYAIIMLTLNTGLRGIDIRKLTLKDIDWHTCSLNIIQSKTGKPVRLPVEGCVCNALAEYILNARPNTDSPYLFIRHFAPFHAFKRTASLDKIIERYCKKAGIPKKQMRSFHSLRRCIGTWMSEEQVQIHTISQILGHSNLNSSKPYLSFNGRQMKLCSMAFEDIPIKGGRFA